MALVRRAGGSLGQKEKQWKWQCKQVSRRASQPVCCFGQCRVFLVDFSHRNADRQTAEQPSRQTSRRASTQWQMFVLVFQMAKIVEFNTDTHAHRETQTSLCVVKSKIPLLPRFSPTKCVCGKFASSSPFLHLPGIAFDHWSHLLLPPHWATVLCP